MDLYDAMRTTFAAREFTTDDVPEEVLARILDNARFAPSGGNRQGWKVIVIRDEAMRQALVPFITAVMSRYRAQVAAGENPYNTIHPSQVTQAQIDAANLAPSYVTVVASMDSDLDRVGVVSGASIYPFAWNILLAARCEGYGGTLTTFLAPHEPEIKKLFNIPDQYAISALLPIGKPVKQLTRLSRNPVSSFTTVDSFNGSEFE